MRPNKLILENFGPFVGKATVDFDNLGEFFLISGRTGSGKTTIFDGLMFALYGETAGHRDERTVVSHHNREEDGAVPGVTLEFSLGLRRYRILRKPTHRRRHKTRQDKSVEEKQYVELGTFENNKWNIETGNLTDINTKIIELIRLTPDEFSKIIMLPQGEFQRFLEEKTKERAEVLEKLFPTAIHGNIAEAFKQRAKRSKDEIKRIEQGLETLLGEFNPETFEKTKSEYTQEIAGAQDVLKEKKDELLIQTANLRTFEGINSDFLRLRKCEENLAALGERSAHFRESDKRLKRARQAERIQPVARKYRQEAEDIERLERELDNNQGRRDKLEAERKTWQSEKELLPGIRSEIQNMAIRRAALEKNLEAFTKLEVLRNKLQGLLNEERKCQNNLFVLQKNQKQLQDELNQPGVNGDALSELSSRLEEFALREKELLENKHRALEVEKTRREIEELEKQTGRLKQNQEQTATHLSINRARREELEKKKEASMAATLAAGLNPAEPCPVCGSQEHPHPANRDTPPFTLEELLEAARRDEAGAARELAGIEENIKRVHTTRSELVTRMESGGPLTDPGESSENILSALEALSRKREEIRRAREDLQNELNRKEARQKRFNEQTEELQTRERELARVQTGLGETRASIEALSQSLEDSKDPDAEISSLTDSMRRGEDRIETIETRGNELDAGIQSLISNRDQMTNQRRDLRARYETTGAELNEILNQLSFSGVPEVEEALLRDYEIEELEQSLKKYDSDKRENDRELADLRRRLKGQKELPLEKIRETLEALETEIAGLEQNREQTRDALRELEGRNKEYLRLQKEREKIGEESSLVVNLARDLNGDNARKISFKNFVLGAYLERVARMATRRLERMSEGRYRLLVNDQGYDQRSQTGLELDVFDSNTGRRRNVRTLSGGEKFMAAISLALGLADVIQERSGGIELGAVFIDEGFGSLDDQSLDRAIGILDEIRGNRMVGVISHVGELKSRIESRIEVVKGKNGSKIRMPA